MFFVFYLLQAAADCDLKYIDSLLNRIAEFAANTRVHTHDMVKVCAADGWNMLHAAIVYKRVEVINKILEYGTGTYDGMYICTVGHV